MRIVGVGEDVACVTTRWKEPMELQHRASVRARGGEGVGCEQAAVDDHAAEAPGELHHGLRVVF